MTLLWTDIQVTVDPHSTEVVVVKGPQMGAKINQQKQLTATQFIN